MGICLFHTSGSKEAPKGHLSGKKRRWRKRRRRRSGKGEEEKEGEVRGIEEEVKKIKEALTFFVFF